MKNIIITLTKDARVILKYQMPAICPIATALPDVGDILQYVACDRVVCKVDYKIIGDTAECCVEAKLP